MVKYFKEFFSDYLGATTLQTVLLLASIAFFVWVIYRVLNKPKKYYEDTSELPLEDEDPLF